MSRRYVAPFRVADHDLDAFGDLRASSFVRIFQQAAIEASAAAGFDGAWYRNAGAMWIVRRTRVDYEGAVRTGDRLDISTWVADIRRVRSLRRYEARRPGEEDLVATGHTDWVYVDTATGRPTRVPVEMAAGLLAGEAEEVPREPLRFDDPPNGFHESRRRVEFRELDGLAHVNNANYLDYALESFLDALAGRGWPLDALLATGGFWRVASHDVEYFREARYGDELRCRTWTIGLDGNAADWCCEIRRGDADDVVARVRTRSRWTDLATRSPAPIPAALKASGFDPNR